MHAVRTDVVGGLQALAEEWLAAERERRDLDREATALENRRNAARTRQETAGKRLAERVGSNVPTKVFVVGDEAVIVDMNRGIVVFRIEAAS